MPGFRAGRQQSLTQEEGSLSLVRPAELQLHSIPQHNKVFAAVMLAKLLHLVYPDDDGAVYSGKTFRVEDFRQVSDGVAVDVFFSAVLIST